MITLIAKVPDGRNSVTVTTMEGVVYSDRRGDSVNYLHESTYCVTGESLLQVAIARWQESPEGRDLGRGACMSQSGLGAVAVAVVAAVNPLIDESNRGVLNLAHSKAFRNRLGISRESRDITMSRLRESGLSRYNSFN